MGHNGYANFYLTDQVDSVKLVTDNDGTAITRFEYLPYGESWFTEGKQKTAPKYNSQELDKETGYYYYNARHYDPEISRFITADSIIDGIYNTQGWNRYSYVKGNPIRYSDPTGNVLRDGSNYEKKDSGNVVDKMVDKALGGNKCKAPSRDRAENNSNQKAEKPGIFSKFIDFVKTKYQNYQVSYHNQLLRSYGFKFNNYQELRSYLGVSAFQRLTSQARLARRYGKPLWQDQRIQVLAVVAMMRFGSNGYSTSSNAAAVTSKRVVTLNSAQQKNINRFKKKVPANAKENIQTYGLPNDGVAVQATSPGKVPGSKAVYEKQIDVTGKTTQYTKTTYDPQGSIVHVKDKINGGTYYLE